MPDSFSFISKEYDLKACYRATSGCYRATSGQLALLYDFLWAATGLTKGFPLFNSGAAFLLRVIHQAASSKARRGFVTFTWLNLVKDNGAS